MAKEQPITYKRGIIRYGEEEIDVQRLVDLTNNNITEPFKGWRFESISTGQEQPPTDRQMTKFWGRVVDDKGRFISHIGQVDAEALLRTPSAITKCKYCGVQATHPTGCCCVVCRPDL